MNVFVGCEVSVKAHITVCGYPVVQAPLVEKIIISPTELPSWQLYQKSVDQKKKRKKSVDHICVDLFLDSLLFIPLICMTLFIPIPHYLDYGHVTVSLEIR